MLLGLRATPRRAPAALDGRAARLGLGSRPRSLGGAFSLTDLGLGTAIESMRSRRHRSGCSLVLVMGFAGSGSAVHGQQVLAVRPERGPGVAFTTLQSAAYAAQDWDILHVKGGSHAGSTVSEKFLCVIEDSGVHFAVNGFVSVSNVPTGGFFLSRGLDVDAGTTNAPAAFQFAQGAGPVPLENCVGTAGSYFVPRPGLTASQCGSIPLRPSTLTGSPGAYFAYFGAIQATAGVITTNTTLSLFDCQVWGGDGLYGVATYPPLGGPPVNPSGCMGANGAEIQGGSAFASSTTFHGGPGGNASTALGGAPRAAARAVTGSFSRMARVDWLTTARQSEGRDARATRAEARPRGPRLSSSVQIRFEVSGMRISPLQPPCANSRRSRSASRQALPRAPHAWCPRTRSRP